MHKLAQSVLRYSRKHDLLRAGDRIGIAVSAGADSVALLRLMLELREEVGLVLSIVHLNHQLRGAESDQDEAFVGELAKSHHLELISRRCDVNNQAAKSNMSIEAAAREQRYQFFREILERNACSKIATAHAIDDQAETVLLKLARGAGTRGIAGIWPKVAVSPQPSAIADDRRQTTGSIVRLLLSARRTQLREYLGELGQSWREDSSNRDQRHTRNRLRHGVLPRLERHINPNVVESLAEAAEIARAEEEYWDVEVERLLPEVWRDESLDIRKLETLPLAVQRRLVRAAAESLKLNLEFRHVEEILAPAPHSKTSLPNDRVVYRTTNFIKFDGADCPPVDYARTLLVPGEVLIPELELTLDAQLVSEGEPNTLLDSQFARGELIVRNWHPGERFWPAHTSTPKKIKELLQDAHITGEEKKSWPVIASGGKVVWMRGFGVGRDFQSKDGSGISIRESDYRATPSREPRANSQDRM